MKIIFLLFFLGFSLLANEKLDGLFAQLKTVSKDDKFKVVNEIKKHIIALKQQERITAIKTLMEKKKEEVNVIEIESMADMEMPSHMEIPEHMEQMQSMGMMENMQTMSNMQSIEGVQNFPIIQGNNNEMLPFNQRGNR